MTFTRRLAALGAAAALSVAGVVGFSLSASASTPDPAVGVSVQELVEGATMSVKPSTIDAGGTTTISGDGCLGRQVQQVVHISIADANENVVASANALPNSDGIWSTDVEVDTAGDFMVFASCDDYFNDPQDYASQTLTVNPVTVTSPTTTSAVTTSAVTTSPTTTSSVVTSTSAACKPTLTLVNYTGAVAQGGSLGVDLTCFEPGESIQVFLHSDPTLLTTLVSDSSGNASGTVTIPLNTAVGAHTISVVGEFSGISLEAPIAVEAAVETSASAPLTNETTSTAQAVEVVTTTTLANTGVNAAAMTVWGVTLMVAGGIAVALTRKRGGKHVGD